jgi:hypothetical protein
MPPVGQHLPAEPVGGGHGQQAEEGRRQAQGEEGVAQRRGHPPGGVEEQRLAAGEAGDEDRPVAAQADVAGVQAIGGLVVVDAGRNLSQLRQAQDGRYQQGQRHERQGVMPAAGAG